MYWKKTSTDYSKWEYFTDSSDSEVEETDPVTPDDDPKFRALKKDMEDRAVRIKLKNKKAEELKQEANKFMRKKNYLKAIEFYSKALEVTKNNKYIWTNRALAHLKREDYDSCIEDCTRILEYCDVLEDGYTHSRDPCFKAFARRAMAYKEKKDYEKALEDAEECLKLFPEDESAILLKKEVTELMETNKKAEELKEEFMDEEKLKEIFEGNEAIKEAIDELVRFKDEEVSDEVKEKMKNFNFSRLSELTKNEEFSLYFFNKNGLESLKRIFKTKAYTNEMKPGTLNYVTFLQIILKRNEFYKEEIIKNNFVRIIAKRITKDLNSYVESTKDPEIDFDEAKLDEVEEFLEVMVCLTETRSCRLYLREKSHILTPIFKIFYEHLLQRFEKLHSLLSSIITLFSNLLIREAGVKRNDIKDLLVNNYLPSLFTSIGIFLTKKV